MTGTASPAGAETLAQRLDRLSREAADVSVTAALLAESVTENVTLHRFRDGSVGLVIAGRIHAVELRDAVYARVGSAGA